MVVVGEDDVLVIEEDERCVVQVLSDDGLMEIEVGVDRLGFPTKILRGIPPCRAWGGFLRCDPSPLALLVSMRGLCRGRLGSFCDAWEVVEEDGR